MGAGTDGATRIDWQDWSTGAFARAQALRRPLLLFLHTTWSAGCRSLAAGALSDERVAALVEATCVPIRVDADRRPDLAERYSLGGWPTLGLLTPYGDLIGGGSFVDTSRLVAALTNLDDAFAGRYDTLVRGALASRTARRAATPPSPSCVDRDAPRRVADRLKQLFDSSYAGFGEAPRVPTGPPVTFAVALGRRTGDAALVELGVRTLDRYGWSAMSDGTGAFNRACATRDWQQPDTARLLEVQADTIRLFLDAAILLDEPAYAERARAALGFVRRTLEDRERGGFLPHGCGDRALFTDGNARMIRAAFRAADVLGDSDWAEAAVRTIERLVPTVYAPGAGVAHYLEEVPRVRGLLGDQVHVAAALLDASEATGSTVYLELAEELARSFLRKYADARTGGLLDRVPSTAGGGDIGLLGERYTPFALNCEAARVLARLARASGHADLGGRAAAVLASQTAGYLDQGALSADYALALLELDDAGGPVGGMLER